VAQEQPKGTDTPTPTLVTTPPPKPGPKDPPPFQLSVPRRVLYLVGGLVTALVLLPLGVYVWRALTVRALEHRMDAQKTEMSEARRQALKLQARDMLRLSARPYAWAIRSEMLKGNLNQIDDYLRQFVREPGVRSLVLIGKDGKVLLASDRKLETQSADALASKAIRTATEVVIEEPGDFIRMGVPIMGFDERMAILVVDYAPPAAVEEAAVPAEKPAR
jgi:hypothetical protein